ncbi:hypothetical protein EVAR_98985_1 [Eumeta japonica]|uniref:Uncharacterized protein n=1 Tax=Eumeta variegata TaxID=151549 RepID=A0A4C1YRJ0_EUMVA|nr:hypothetical protein EVAR_98985_1 [Eumeta japonica]
MTKVGGPHAVTNTRATLTNTHARFFGRAIGRRRAPPARYDISGRCAGGRSPLCTPRSSVFKKFIAIKSRTSRAAEGSPRINLPPPRPAPAGPAPPRRTNVPTFDFNAKNLLETVSFAVS